MRDVLKVSSFLLGVVLWPILDTTSAPRDLSPTVPLTYAIPSPAGHLRLPL